MKLELDFDVLAELESRLTEKFRKEAENACELQFRAALQDYGREQRAAFAPNRRAIDDLRDSLSILEAKLTNFLADLRERQYRLEQRLDRLLEQRLDRIEAELDLRERELATLESEGGRPELCN